MKEKLENVAGHSGRGSNERVRGTFSVHGENSEGRFHIWVDRNKLSVVDQNVLYKNSNADYGKPGYFETRKLDATAAANAGIVKQLLDAAPGELARLDAEADELVAKRQRVAKAIEEATHIFVSYSDKWIKNEIVDPPFGMFRIDDLTTGEKVFELFSDDGRGNGNLILAVRVSDLLTAVQQWTSKKQRIFEGLDDA